MPVGSQELSRRWVVKQTFACLGRYHRLSKDDVVLPETEKAWNFASMSRLMVARLAR